MFGIGMTEMLLILAIALIVVGPKKLPELAKSLGRAFGEFRRATSEIKESFEQDTGLKDLKNNLYNSTKKELDKVVLNMPERMEKPLEQPAPEPMQTAGETQLTESVPKEKGTTHG